jgi:membrane associated rhomboid family serine protease
MEQNKRSRLLLGQDNNALTWLIIINAVAFVIVNFIKIIYQTTDVPLERFYSEITSWITLPANPGTLLTHAWTLLTYMFVHVGVFELIGTLLWLWAFGYIMQDLAGNQKLLPVYLYGGLAGALCFLLSVNLVPAFHTGAVQPLAGAGASLMAIAVATTTLAPGYRLFTMLNGGIPLWVLTVVFVAIDYAGIAGSNPGFALAHLGGAAIGFIYVKQLQRGNDWGQWMTNSINWLDNLFNPEKKHLGQPSKQTHFYKASRTPYQKKSNVTQQRVDDLLDKINQHGYSRLTEEEKTFLKRASEEQDSM